jgi:predicted RND superfamily exporter protein
MVGAFVIILDPIFQGLAVSLLFGVGASTLLTLIVIPVLYFHMSGRRRTPVEHSTDPIFGNGEPTHTTQKTSGALIT